MNPRAVFVVLLLLVSPLGAQSVSIATYNIENFQEHFLARNPSAQRKTLPDTPEVTDLLERERFHNEEDNWETAQVILDPKFSPDLLVIQEGCTQENLEYFNRTYLKDVYATAITFKTNTDRDQHLNLLLKPGFKVLERKADYYREVDAVPNERGNLLFARGPAFALIETPAGYRFWVGTNHQKSKSDNSLDVTQWRNREAKRTHQIIKEIEAAGPKDVVFLGDMNDEVGIQGYELQGGGDAIANLLGPAADGLVLATRPLAEAGKISYFGYLRQDHRSLIDHILVTASVKDQILDVSVFQNSFTAVSSDHAPVLMHLRPDPAGRN